MPLTTLLQRFDAIGVFDTVTPITIDQTFTGSADLASILDYVLDSDSITIQSTSQTRTADGSSLEIVGTASLLHLEDVRVKFSASEIEGSPLFTLEIEVPRGWKFSTSFPDIPVDYDPSKPPKEERKGSSFLDRLGWGAVKLVLSNRTHYNEALQANLVAGLNFVGELYYTGLLFNLGRVLGDDGPVIAAGPIIEYFRTAPNPTEFQGIRIDVPLVLPSGSLPLPIDDSRILIKSPINYGQQDPTVGFAKGPGIYAIATVTVSGRSVELVAKLEAETDELVLMLYGRMKDFSLSGFSSLTQQVGGDDLESSLPAELSTPQGLQLTEFGIGVNFSTQSLISAMVGVGVSNSWELIPDKLSLENIGVTFRISNPFDKKTRKIQTGVSGLFAFPDAELAAYAEFPDFRMRAGLPEGKTIPLGSVIERYLPNAPEMPPMTINELMVHAEPKQKNFLLNAQISDLLSIPVGNTSFELEGINFLLDHSGNAGTTGSFSATMTIAEATAVVAGTLEETFTLRGSLSDLQLQRFWDLVTGGQSLPEEVPDILFKTVSLSVSPATGDFSLLANTSIEWDGLPLNGSLKTDVEFSFQKVNKSITARLSFKGSGPLEVCDNFTFEHCDLAFEYKSRQGWKLSGGATVTLFDSELYLAAKYEKLQQRQLFTLTGKATPAGTLIDLKSVAKYTFRQLDLKVDRQGKGKASKTFWNLRVDSTLKIEKVATIGGFLTIADDADGRQGLLFNPTEKSAKVAIKLGSGKDAAAVNLSLFEIGIIRENAQGGWCFSSTVDFGIKGLPQFVDDVLPSKMRGRLMVGKKETRLSAVDVTDVVSIKLPKVDGKDPGAMYLQLSEVGLDVRPDVGLVLDAGLAFSSKMNTFLGSQVFRTYVEGDRTSLSRTRFTVSPKGGIAVQFITSPFLGANAVSVQGESWVDIKFGQYGAIRMKLPTFKYDGITQYFEAGSGVEITKPLALPMAPIIELFKACKLDAAAKAMPKKIPIKDVKLIDKNGKCKTDALIKFLEGAGKLPSEVKKIIKGAGNLVNRFPKSFKNYLNIEIPKKIECKCGFSPTGRLTLDLRSGKKPIRMLQPAMIPGAVPMPGLVGIELRRLTIGTIASGSLFYAIIDGQIDLFDFGTLAASLALPKEEDFPLPTSNQLQRRLILNNLFMIIPLQQGVPIPVPIFYDQIGLESIGLEGVNLQGHIGFPAPELSASGVMEFFSTLKSFFSNRKTLLDPKKAPGGIDLGFDLSDNYLQLPEYLGSKVLGMRGKPVHIGLWQHVAHALNFMKTFSLNEMIQAVPIKHRVGSAKHKFAFLKFDADWLITTPQEFKDGAFKQLKLTQSDREDFLTVLPSVQTTAKKTKSIEEEGLVVFLRGAADLAVVGLDVAFGLASSSSMGFNTGFKFTGQLLKMLELEMSGAVAIGDSVAILGHTHMAMFNHRIFQGDLALQGKTFLFAGKLNLFPNNWPITVKGDVSGLLSDKKFELAGNVSTKLFGLKLLSTKTFISQKRFLIRGKLFGAFLDLDVYNDRGSPAMKGSVGFKQKATLNFGKIMVGKVKVADNVKISIDLLLDLDVTISKSKLGIGVRARFKINGKGFDIRFKLSKAPQDIKALVQAAVDEITSAPEKYLKGMFDDVGRWLDNTKKGVIQLADQTGETAGKAMKALGASADKAAKELKKAGYKVDKVANALSSGFTKNANAAAKALRTAGFGGEDCGKALKARFSRSAETVGKALKSAGFNANDIGKVWKKSFGKSANDTAKFMRQTLKLNDKAVNNALKGAGYAAKEVEKAMKSVFNWANDAGKAIGKTANDVGKKLKKVFKF